MSLRSLNLQEKINLLNDLKNGASQASLVEKYKVSKSTVCRLAKSENEILAQTSFKRKGDENSYHTKISKSRTDMFTRCRACLQLLNRTGEVTFDLLTTPKLAQKFSACTTLGVSTDDKVSNELCLSCYNKVLDFYEFQKQCIDADKRAREICLTNSLNLSGKLEEDKKPIFGSEAQDTEEMTISESNLSVADCMVDYNDIAKTIGLVPCKMEPVQKPDELTISDADNERATDSDYSETFIPSGQASYNTLVHDRVVTNSYREFGDQEPIQQKISAGIYKLLDMPKRKSEIWSIFAIVKKDDDTILDGYVCCRKCIRLLKYDGRHSSNLNRHKCFASASQEVHIRPLSQEDKNAFFDICCQWIVEDCRPISAIKGSGFQKILKYLLSIGARCGENVDLNDMIPDTTRISKQISKKAQEKKHVIKNVIKTVVEKFEGAVTTFLWTDQYVRRNYMCVTLHYHRNSELCNTLLGVKSMDITRSSAENIRSKLKIIFAEFDISNLDDLVFITDSGSCINETLENIVPISCSNHLFSKVLLEAGERTSELREIVQNCKKLVKFLKKANLQNVIPISSYCPTLWYSNFILFKCITDNWLQIVDYFKKRNQKHILGSIDIDTLLPLVALYQDFDTISKKLAGYNCPSICFVLPSINKLKAICKPRQHDAQVISNFKINILNELRTWTDSLNVHHKAAFFLYPPANGLQQNEKDLIKDFCIAEITKRYNHRMESAASCEVESHESQRSQCKSEELAFFFPELVNVPFSRKQNGAIAEFERYAMEHVIIDDNFNAMTWWQNRSTDFPILSKFAMYLLSIPASCAASERVSALARNIVTERTNCLTSKNVNNILFLNSLLDTL